MLERIFTAHQALIWRIARRCGLTRELAADLTEETFRLAAGHLQEIDSPRERAFLIGTALGLARSHLPAARHRRKGLMQGAVSGATDELELLDLALARLDLALVEVFVLFEVEQLPLCEIALALDKSPAALSPLLTVAREQFRQALDDLALTVYRERNSGFRGPLWNRAPHGELSRG